MGTITQDLDLFRMPVTLHIETDGNPEEKQIEVVGASSEFAVDTLRQAAQRTRRNVGTASLTLHSSVNYMDSSGPHTLALPDQTLAVGQALNLQLGSAVQLPANSRLRQSVFQLRRRLQLPAAGHRKCGHHRQLRF